MQTSQAWNIDHLENSKREDNQTILAKIASIMETNEQVSLEIRGETTKHTKAEALGEWFGIPDSRWYSSYAGVRGTLADS